MNNMQKSFKRKSALRCMAEGGAVYKSDVGGVPTFSDAPGSGALYTPGSPTPAPAPPQTIGPPSSLAPPPLPVPPPAAKISPLAIGPKSDLIAKTGGFGPTPAPMSTYQKAGGTGSIGSMPSRIGVNRPEIGANRVPIGERRPEIGAPRMGALGRPIMTSVGYASGGKVRGPGGPTEDKIPAMLSDGEFVVRAAAVDEIGVDALNKINSLGGPMSGKSKLRNGVTYAADGLSPEDKRLQNQQLTGTRELLQGQPMPPPPATKFVEAPRPSTVGPPTPEMETSPTMNSAWRAAQTAPAGESAFGAAGRNIRSFGAAALAPVESGLRYMSGSLTSLGGAAADTGRGLAGLPPAIPTPNAAAPAPAPAPAPGAPAPGGKPALPEGVTQRPDGIYQQGNSFTNIVGADGKPQLLQEERMGPPSPAAEAYLARTPEMQFGPIPSGPGSSLRSGRGGGMRLNMPGASSGINARFDKMVADYTKNANWGLSPSKTARTLADIEQARTNALNGVMGNDTTRRGQDMAASSAAARDAAGLAQEGMRGQFGLLAGEAAASAAAQKAQDAKEMADSKEDRANFDQMYGDKPEKNEAFETYAANRHLLPDGVEGVQQAGAMLGMLKAAGLAPGTRIEAFGANPVTGGAGSEESDLGTRYDAAGGGLRGLGAALNPADLFGDDNYYTIHTKAGPKKVARRALKGGDSQLQTWQELLGRNIKE